MVMVSWRMRVPVAWNTVVAMAGATHGIYAAPESPEWRQRSGRVVDLLMDGLRRGARDDS